jgi:hypothetical protein
VIDRLDDLLGRRVSLRALEMLRIAVGPVTLLHLWPFLDAARHGRIYRDVFYEPYAAWYPELPRAMYVALLWVGAAAAVLMTVGLLTRLATATTAVVVAYNLFLSTTHFHSNRAFLVIVLAGLAAAPLGRELSVDTWRRARRGLAQLAAVGVAWPLWLLRFEASVVYGASGLSKLVDGDWFGGTVTWHRMVLSADRLTASALPDWAVSVLTTRDFHTYAAKVVVLTELFIALGVWWRATRYAAVWVAVCFHLAIEVSASVQVFSALAIAALLIWAVPSVEDRVLMLDPADVRQRRLGRLVHHLDWMARFVVVDGPPGAPVQVTDRDGTRRTGVPAVVLALSRLPLTAWFALPATPFLSRNSAVAAEKRDKNGEGREGEGGRSVGAGGAVVVAEGEGPGPLTAGRTGAAAVEVVGGDVDAAEGA